MNDDKSVHDDLRKLANGINFAIASLNNGVPMDFMFVLVRPEADGDHVTLNTITGLTEPAKIRQIGHHLIDMANAQSLHELDPENDREVQGHA